MGMVPIKVAEPEDRLGGSGAGIDVGIRSGVSGPGSAKGFEFGDCIVHFAVVVDVVECQFSPTAADGNDGNISGQVVYLFPLIS